MDQINNKFEELHSLKRFNALDCNSILILIRKKEVLITLGQILRLCENLLNKVIDLQQYKLDHYYLISNRIWLKLTQNNKLLTIAHEDIEYQIVFTGFQCPIFENQQNKQSASTSIIQIMIQIINVFETNFHHKRIFIKHKIGQDNYIEYIILIIIITIIVWSFQNKINIEKTMEYGISKLFYTILHHFNFHEGFFKEDVILGLISIIGEIGIQQFIMFGCISPQG
ncbi:unnamed protein product [Paramecium pentaurelia]|uniref:Transmembrane protein n=1 Tax=Paramecium pentaurelia TaxID=43138 RepID=A0A8S1SVF2_9CILI|nr:unnamed protein product [Paramecium pentaurelia]